MSLTASPTQNASARCTPSISSETYGQVQSLAHQIQAMLSTDGVAGHVVGVTSCSRREGVSVVAGQLAACAAELATGRVLLVDANPRFASLARRYGVCPSPGLSDCLRGDVSIDKCITLSADRNLHLLPAGTYVGQPARSSEKHTQALFASLRRNFELIVVDLPPASEIDELLVASQRFDGFLLVLEAERVRRHVAQRAKRLLEQLDARLLGVVLNKRKDHIPGWLYRRL